MRVAELEGALLDFWVARACGRDAVINTEKNRCALWNRLGTAISDSFMGWFEPSTNGSDAVPIIEHGRINLVFLESSGVWTAGRGEEMAGIGPTPLIAAMRAFVVHPTGAALSMAPGRHVATVVEAVAQGANAGGTFWQALVWHLFEVPA